MPLALFLAWWLGSRIMVPVQTLRKQVLAKVSEAAPRADLDVGRQDEFGELTQAFNALLSTLEERNKANEGFVADLTHEFKNPVAAVRAAAAGRFRRQGAENPLLWAPVRKYVVDTI